MTGKLGDWVQDAEDALEIKGTGNVNVLFPGLPPEQELKAMFDDGVLKYTAYTSYLSQIHCIPFEHFNEKQVLPQHVANPNLVAETRLAGEKRKASEQASAKNKKKAKT